MATSFIRPERCNFFSLASMSFEYWTGWLVSGGSLLSSSIKTRYAVFPLLDFFPPPFSLQHQIRLHLHTKNVLVAAVVVMVVGEREERAADVDVNYVNVSLFLLPLDVYYLYVMF